MSIYKIISMFGLDVAVGINRVEVIGAWSDKTTVSICRDMLMDNCYDCSLVERRGVGMGVWAFDVLLPLYHVEG